MRSAHSKCFFFFFFFFFCAESADSPTRHTQSGVDGGVLFMPQWHDDNMCMTPSSRPIHSLAQPNVGSKENRFLKLGSKEEGSSTTTTTRTWLHKADLTYSRAGPKNKSRLTCFLYGVMMPMSSNDSWWSGLSTTARRYCITCTASVALNQDGLLPSRTSSPCKQVRFVSVKAQRPHRHAT